MDRLCYGIFEVFLATAALAVTVGSLCGMYIAFTGPLYPLVDVLWTVLEDPLGHLHGRRRALPTLDNFELSVSYALCLGYTLYKMARYLWYLSFRHQYNLLVRFAWDVTWQWAVCVGVELLLRCTSVGRFALGWLYHHSIHEVDCAAVEFLHDHLCAPPMVALRFFPVAVVLPLYFAVLLLEVSGEMLLVGVLGWDLPSKLERWAAQTDTTQTQVRALVDSTAYQQWLHRQPDATQRLTMQLNAHLTGRSISSLTGCWAWACYVAARLHPRRLAVWRPDPSIVALYAVLAYCRYHLNQGKLVPADQLLWCVTLVLPLVAASLKMDQCISGRNHCSLLECLRPHRHNSTATGNESAGHEASAGRRCIRDALQLHIEGLPAIATRLMASVGLVASLWLWLRVAVVNNLHWRERQRIWQECPLWLLDKV